MAINSIVPDLNIEERSIGEWITTKFTGSDEAIPAVYSASASDRLRSKVHTHMRLFDVPLRTYQPHTYKTVLSEGQLTHCGLKVLSHDAERWLVPVDVEELHDAPPSVAWLAQVRGRIDSLRDIAEDEGLAFNEESAEAALRFAARVYASVRPSAFLIGNGNVRLVWESTAGEQIGLQFLTDRDIQYVLFTKRGDILAQTFGNDDGSAVLRIVTATGLRHLLKP